jgi:hypothetical protein
MWGCTIKHVRYVARFTEQPERHALSDIVSLPVSFTAGLPTFPCDIIRLSSRGARSKNLESCWLPLEINFQFVSVMKIIT